MARVPRSSLDARDLELLNEVRLGHLATANAAAHPHVMPVCFAILDDRTLVFAVDDKPKIPGRRLRRMRNLEENARFALVVDRWDEDWSRLAYCLVEGVGRPIHDPGRKSEALDRLRARYPQYVEMGLGMEHELTALEVHAVRRWAART